MRVPNGWVEEYCRMSYRMRYGEGHSGQPSDKRGTELLIGEISATLTCPSPHFRGWPGLSPLVWCHPSCWLHSSGGLFSLSVLSILSVHPALASPALLLYLLLDFTCRS